MKVRLLTSRVLSTGQTQTWGDVIDVDPKEGQALIRAQQAENVDEPQVKPAQGQHRKGA